MNIFHLTPEFAVSGQLREEHFETLAACGFTTLVNNRPDGEKGDYLTADEVQALAVKHGLDYHFIPVDGRGPLPVAIAQTARIMTAGKGPVVAYCRSGQRSAALWALASAGPVSPADIIEVTGKAGYDLTGMLPALEAYAQARRQKAAAAF